MHLGPWDQCISIFIVVYLSFNINYCVKSCLILFVCVCAIDISEKHSIQHYNFYELCCIKKQLMDWWITFTSQTRESVSCELESELSSKVCSLNVALVCFCCEATCLHWFPICCLSASLTLCQTINLRGLTVTCLLVPGRNIFSL